MKPCCGDNSNTSWSWKRHCHLYMYCNLLQFWPCHWILLHIIYHISLCSTRWNFMKSQNLSASRHTLALESETSPFLELIRFDPGAEPGCEMRSMKTWSRVPGVLVPHTWVLCPSSYMYAMRRIIWGQSLSVKCRSVIAGFALHKAQERGGSTKAFTSSQSVSGSFWPLDFVLKFRAFAKLHLFCGVKSIRVKPIWLQHQLHSAWTQRCARPVCKGIATTQLKWWKVFHF